MREHGDVTLISLQDGNVVMRDGKVGTEQDCCCEQECDVSSADELTQPNVTITDDGCPCETGSLSGSYAYSGVGFFGYEWNDTTDCDVDGFNPGTEFYAPMVVNVTDGCQVLVSTYRLGSGGLPSGLSGETDGSSALSVNGSGEIVGTVVVSLSGGGDTDVCNLTITFGP